jgi:hypothetical protein
MFERYGCARIAGLGINWNLKGVSVVLGKICR